MTKEELYTIALDKISAWKLDNYHTIFLTNMVVRKYRHPKEKINEIAIKVMQLMKKTSYKKDLVIISSKKCLENLETALEDSDVPSEWLTGNIVSHVVKELVNQIRIEYDD